jgi:hypothetical protein
MPRWLYYVWKMTVSTYRSITIDPSSASSWDQTIPVHCMCNNSLYYWPFDFFLFTPILMLCFLSSRYFRFHPFSLV